MKIKTKVRAGSRCSGIPVVPRTPIQYVE